MYVRTHALITGQYSLRHLYTSYVSVTVCVNMGTIHLYTGPPPTSPTSVAPLVSNMHATTSIAITTTQMLGSFNASKTVPHDGIETVHDSTLLTSIQLVYPTAKPSSLITHVTMATKASTHIF